MDVFGKGTEEGTRPLLPPGLCWICDNAPQQEEMKVIDTRRNSRPGMSAINVTERKYICEPCAREMGGAMGMVSPEKYEEAIEAGRKLEAEVAVLQGDLELARNSQTRVIAADEIADVVSETVRAELAKSVKPKAPAKKTEASDA